MVVEVVSRDLDEVEILKIRDRDGMVWTFATEGFVGFTPAHLVEHQISGNAVTVTFREKDTLSGRVLMASFVTD